MRDRGADDELAAAVVQHVAGAGHLGGDVDHRRLHRPAQRGGEPLGVVDAVLQAEGSGQSAVDGGNILAAFYQAEQSYAVYLLLQQGVTLVLPHSRPMPTIGPRCHELRIIDRGLSWRIVYRIDSDAIVVAAVFSKKTAQTPQAVLEICQGRLKEYDDE